MWGFTKKFKIHVAASLGLLGSLLAWACAYRDDPRVYQKDLAYFVQRLSSDSFGGREAGTLYGQKTAAFLSAYYKRHDFFPAFGGRYIQEFPFQAGIEAAVNQNWLQWRPSDTKSTSPLITKPVLPLPLSASKTVSGELLFVGYCLDVGKEWNDLEGLNLKGKVALCLRYGPGGKENTKFARHISFAAKYRSLRRSGVKGVLFLGKEGHAPPSIQSWHSDLQKKGPPAAFIEPGIFKKYDKYKILYYDRQWDQKPSSYRGRSFGQVRLQTAFARLERKGLNVGAFLNAPRAKEAVVVIGAHSDHLGWGNFASLGQADRLHNGADDNASGTAAVLEIARALQEEERQSSQRSSARPNVLFLHFDAEEWGLLGSTAFIKSSYFQSLRVIAMLNLDMVGRLRPDRSLSIQGAQTADDRWKALLQDSFRRAAFPPGHELYFIKGGHGPSDHSVFYRQKIPVAFFFTGGHRQYHTEDDDFERINVKGLWHITRMNHLLIQSLRRLERPLAYRRAKVRPERRDFGFQVRLGIVPIYYNTDNSGLEVGQVLADAPVARSGLRAGDRIVRLGSKPIKNIHDLMDFLEDASAYKEYTLIYDRKGQKHRTKTRLMP